MQHLARGLFALVYLLAVLLPFWKFAPRFATHLIGDHGDALLQHLHCSWQWLALAEGRFTEVFALPTMAPYTSGLSFGEPLLGIMLPFLPVYWLTGSTAAAFNCAVVASFVLLAVAMCLWVRSIFGSLPAGLLAGMLVLFAPWRLHYLTAVNVLTLHYAVFGMWLVHRWLQQRRGWQLLAAALLFHIQLVTSVQGGVPAIYLTSTWLAVEWAAVRFRLETQRCVQLVAAGGLFLGLSLPWLGFFQEAFDAGSGLPPMSQMARYSQPFADMAVLMGATGPLGISACLALLALPFGLRRGWLSRAAAVTLAGVCLGGAWLFVVGRGPFRGPETDATLLPGYYASMLLPLVGMFRAPIRLAGLSPLILALLAGAGMALIDQGLRPRLSALGRGILCGLPLLCVFIWPTLDAGMAAPITARPADLALAQTLAQLPKDASIATLPMRFGIRGASVDERVIVHRRHQIGAFASLVPPVFRQVAFALGEWPQRGAEFLSALGATHVVVPARWVERHHPAALAAGYVRVAEAEGHVVMSVPPLADEPGDWRVDAPRIAAAGHWLTLALSHSTHRFEARGHQPLTAHWSLGDQTLQVEALLLSPGVLSPHTPARIHVPTPSTPGHYRLQIPFTEHPIEIKVEVRPHPTSFDNPIATAQVTLAPGFRPPDFLRADASFSVDVEVRAGPGPILLASSRHILPPTRGATQLLVQYRSRGQRNFTFPLPEGATLARDLAPHDVAQLRWAFPTPQKPGQYSVYVRLISHGLLSQPMPWTPLLLDLEFEED